MRQGEGEFSSSNPPRASVSGAVQPAGRPGAQSSDQNKTLAFDLLLPCVSVCHDKKRFLVASSWSGQSM